MHEQVFPIFFQCFLSQLFQDIFHEVDRNQELFFELIKKFGIYDIEADILLNLQYLLYEYNKEVDYSENDVSAILKKFYDIEQLTEDNLLKWREKKIEIEKHFAYNKEFNDKMIQ